MVLCNCKNGARYIAHKCKDCNQACQNDGSVDDCVDNKTLGMATEIVITLLILSYVFFLIILYYVLQTVQRCKGNPSWLAPTLTSLVILTLVLGWVPILNILLIMALIVITMHYYVSCGGKRGGKQGGKQGGKRGGKRGGKI